MPPRLVLNSDNVEIHVHDCPKCGEPMRIFHYFMRELTPRSTFIENEREKLTQIYDFQLICPKHKDKKDAYHFATPELTIINQYTPGQFKIIIDSEPNAPATQKILRGDDIKKLR